MMLTTLCFSRRVFSTRHAMGWISTASLLCLSMLLHAQSGSPLQAGFGKRAITPIAFDVYEDQNGNAKFDDGEPWLDVDQNGVFNPLYLAGFDNNRPATGVHDDIYAVASVMQQQETRIAIVSLDAVGFMIDDVEDLRQRLPQDLAIDHLVIHSTHNHEVPDTQGLWGPTILESGINPDYMERVKSQAVNAVRDAVQAMQPVDLHMADIQGREQGLGVRDSRDPQVIDSGIRSLIFTKTGSREVVGTIVNWANHTELLWSRNTLITADYIGYLRNGLESGLVYDDETVLEGLGGITLYLNGNIGGLMTTFPDTPVYDVHLERNLTGATFEKARAQGYGVARIVIDAWQQEEFELSQSQRVQVFREKVEAKVSNTNFILGAIGGIVEREWWWAWGMRTWTELNILTVGDAWIGTIPGELYPELAVGGIEHPPGADFDDVSIETPPMREVMKGRVNLMVNLANDSIGYIIPRAEWDEDPPYLYLDDDSPYGESNSMGPWTGPLVHETFLRLADLAATATQKPEPVETEKQFQVGYAQQDLSPEPSVLEQENVYLGGIGFLTARGKSEEILDPVWSRALCLSDTKEQFCLAVLDVPGITNTKIQRIIDQVVNEVALNPDHILVSSTHTHSGPDMQGLWGGVPDVYRDRFLHKAAQAIIEAYRAMQPADIRVAQGTIAGTQNNRRDWGIADDSLTVLDFRNRQGGHRIATLINFGAHPASMDDSPMSSDWPHFVRHYMEQHTDAPSLFVNGIMGDITARIPSPGGYEGVEQYGKQLAQQAYQILEQSQLVDPDLNIITQSYSNPVQNPLFILASLLGITDHQGVFDIEHWWRGFNVITKVSYFSLGSQVQGVTFPGEAVTRLGLPIKEQMQAPYKLFFGLTHDTLGYHIPLDEWASGRNDYYEESISVSKAVGERAQDILTSLIQNGNTPED